MVGRCRFQEAGEGGREGLCFGVGRAGQTTGGDALQVQSAHLTEVELQQLPSLKLSLSHPWKQLKCFCGPNPGTPRVPSTPGPVGRDGHEHHGRSLKKGVTRHITEVKVVTRKAENGGFVHGDSGGVASGGRGMHVC